ncbi:NAD(P)-dependent alcohol dehydrogenase [Actinosynnema pretiosum subsp. pretiosum]|uniref:Alcohol dehydrogenase zinc-binding domain protein n=2 Tax=Actinosynnema TaxID=40566 RepID=C6WA87_ACTMD|nr:NAD(P)-dependent alcohol dehydrogenase [Actinosynnema mirum]ACU39276.1 Alcohol dehydrogenase zinc-binding domain protein [Actinosynnema mirum DSM 43827]QUF03256.1 NAD(P)-dependent alcohol dehydrogenase [Actinosynnema pretiosum subsp. pretiosum]
MRAVVQDAYGIAGVLRVEEVPEPEPGEGEVLVRVRAAGVDQGVRHLVTGEPGVARLAIGVRRPRNRVPGADLAGVVERVGGGVRGFAVGDEVLGVGRGAFAELARASADRIVRKPASLSFAEAAALPISGVTALQAVRGRVGERVLVLGASGGVGSYAVQLAKALGARVTGVCSGGKAGFVRSLGADEVVDHREAEPTGRYDLVVDTGGRRPLRALRRLLTPRGALVIVGGEGGGAWFGGLQRQLGALLLTPLVRQSLTCPVSLVGAEDLHQLVGFVERGQLRVPLDRAYPLERAEDALLRLSGGRVLGKVVLTV